MINKIRNLFTILVFVLVIALPTNMVKAYENDAEEWVYNALKYKTFYHFNSAYAKIMAMPDNPQKNSLLEKLAPIEKDIKTEEVNKIIALLTEVAETGSAKAYSEVEEFLRNSKVSDLDKEYLLGELTGWGKKLVWTEDYKKAVDALRDAWDKKDSEAIIKGESIISQVKNKHSREYLIEQLRPLKEKNSSIQTEKKMLSVREIADNFKSLVSITVRDSSNNEIGSGNGFITSSDGEVVTTYNVIEGAYYAEVTLINGKKYNVSGVLASDSTADIAVLKLDNASGLTPVKIGDSDKLGKSDKVVALTIAIQDISSASQGNISSLNQTSDIREGTDIHFIPRITDRLIGSSLFDMYGNVIGLIYGRNLEGESHGLAIPINELKQYLGEEVTKPLGEVSGTIRPQAPTGVAAAAISDSEIKVQWSPVTEADYYYLYYRNNDGAYNYFKNEDGTKKQLKWQPDYSAKLDNIPNEKAVYFKVTAIKNEIESKYSRVVKTTTFPKLEFFPLLSDIPVFQEANYTFIEGNLENGTPTVTYFYKNADIKGKLNNYLSTIELLLKNNGWEVYKPTINSDNSLSKLFKKDTNSITITLTLKDGGMQIFGEVH